MGRNGGDITASGVNYILRNETYVGDKRLLKTGRKELFTGAVRDHESILLENDHEAIIDRDTWENLLIIFGSPESIVCENSEII